MKKILNRFYFSNKLYFKMRAINTKINTKVKRKKSHLKAKESSRTKVEKRSSNNFPQKRHRFTIIASHFVQKWVARKKPRSFHGHVVSR